MAGPPFTRSSSPFTAQPTKRSAASKSLGLFANQMNSGDESSELSEPPSEPEDEHPVPERSRRKNQASRTKVFPSNVSLRVAKPSKSTAALQKASGSTVKSVSRSPSPEFKINPTQSRKRVARTIIPTSPMKRSRYSDSDSPNHGTATAVSWPLAQSTSSITRPSKSSSDTWKLSSMDFVYVRLSEGGCTEGDSSMPCYWWPGRVRSQTSPVVIKLYGDDGHGSREVYVLNPSEKTILSMRSALSANCRFNSSNFMQPSNGTAGEMQDRFKAALEEMARADAEENDDLPDPFFMFSSQGSRVTDTDSLSITKSVILSPEEQGFDEMLTIPGESVFARSVRDKGAMTEYWPARVLQWFPPINSSNRGKYQLQFFDGISIQADRTWFFTYFEDGFSTCKVNLPKIKGYLKSGLPVNGDSDGSLISRERQVSSPELCLSNPPADFNSLSVDDRIRCIGPILLMIINNEYPHAKPRHDKFMTGGRARQALQQEGATRGSLSGQRMVEVADALRWWALRDEQFAIFLELEEGRPSSEPSDVDCNTTITGLDTLTEPPTTPEHEQTLSLRSSAQVENPLSNHAAANHCPTPDLPCSIPPETPHRLIVSRNNSSTSTMANGLTSQPPNRPRGGADYEALSRSERSQYCTDVLLPETILQYLLWEGRHRKTLHPGEDEEALYQAGVQLAAQQGPDQWILDIITMREGEELKKVQPEDGAKAPPPEDRGTRTRPAAKRSGL